MTVLIGFSFPDLAVLGADGRGAAVDDPNDIDDSVQKICKTGFGLMAGAGRSDVIEAVTNRFKDHVPDSNQGASEIIRDEVAKLRLAEDDPALELTTWLSSFVTNTSDGLRARLTLANRADNYSFGHFPDNRVVIIRPAGMTEEVGRQFTEEAQARFDRRIRNAADNDRLGLCVLLIRSLVDAISKQNDTVGPRWSVAYQDTHNTLRLSNVCDNPDALEWH